MLRGARIAVVVASVTGCLVLASSAPAATLLGDYQLQGTRSSSGPGPDLTDVVGPETFQTESVMGTSRQVLAFPLGSGVRMSPVGFGSATPTYSVVTTFRLDAVDDYRKILDSSGGVSDDGIYDLDGLADYFGENEVKSPSAVFSPGVYATVAILSEPPSSTKIFVNGSQVVTANETLPVTIDSLRFFVDDGTTTGENSAGAVSCIRVYTGALTDAEVGAIGASATCQAPPPQSTKKKCKKHKKKHKRSAESAKKKKCKKKKKKG